MDRPWHKKHRGIITVTTLIAIVSTTMVALPVAGAEEQPWRQTFSVFYWPTTLTGQVQLTGSRGTLTNTGNAISQPFLIFDYRVVSPASVGLHLYYSPMMGASGFNSGVTGNAGLWERRPRTTGSFPSSRQRYSS